MYYSLLFMLEYFLLVHKCGRSSINLYNEAYFTYFKHFTASTLNIVNEDGLHT